MLEFPSTPITWVATLQDYSGFYIYGTISQQSKTRSFHLKVGRLSEVIFKSRGKLPLQW